MKEQERGGGEAQPKPKLIYISTPEIYPEEQQADKKTFDIVYFTFISEACFKLGRHPKEWQNQQNTNQASNQPEAKCHQQSRAKKGDEKATETETKQTNKKERREIMLTFSESRDQQGLADKLSVGA